MEKASVQVIFSLLVGSQSTWTGLEVRLSKWIPMINPPGNVLRALIVDPKDHHWPSKNRMNEAITR
jgi:hypothetical protein